MFQQIKTKQTKKKLNVKNYNVMFAGCDMGRIKRQKSQALLR